MRCFFVSDLHGHAARYQRLFATIERQIPQAVFIGGDILPFGSTPKRGGTWDDESLLGRFSELKSRLGEAYPRVFLILGNDDPRIDEPLAHRGHAEGLWTYVHNARSELCDYTVYGYACVPPSPFRLKDWERYDVSRYIPPGGVSPERGIRTVDYDANDVRYGTIAKDLDRLVGEDSMDRAVFLFHSPPFETKLDRIDIKGKMIDHVPLDANVGSIAIRRFIEERQPLLTLHGHVHESTRLTGSWRDRIGRTHMFNASHDGPELSLVRFDPEELNAAERELL